MANTSAQVLTDSFSEILSYADGTGSVNFYMAHGGTNFGWTAGELRTGGWGWGGVEGRVGSGKNRVMDMEEQLCNAESCRGTGAGGRMGVGVGVGLGAVGWGFR